MQACLSNPRQLGEADPFFAFPCSGVIRSLELRISGVGCVERRTRSAADGKYPVLFGGLSKRERVGTRRFAPKLRGDN